ncbi:MAG: hypothetical protein ACU84J_01730 [Gammaproteobacteria bacterium]
MSKIQSIFIVMLTVLIPFKSALPENDRDGDHPSYNFQEGILTIPRVDSEKQAGYFQDAVFKLEQDGSWRLLTFATADIELRWDPQIDNVEVIMTTASPVQVFLKLSGVFSNGCGEIGRIHQRMQGNLFEVTVFAAPIPAGVACTAAIKPFQKRIPLPVFELPAGTYDFSVNGRFSGTFTLDEDNGLDL